MTKQKFYDRPGWLMVLGLYEHYIIACEEKYGLEYRKHEDGTVTLWGYLKGIEIV